ncbi:MAG: carbohydrate binding family 9 domain-containing protein [candidate division Zixibacteria bacterium]
MKTEDLTMKSAIFAIGMLILFMFFTGSVSATFEPMFNPSLEIGKSAGNIEIDGNLDDPGWRNASRAGNFAESYPGDNIEPIVDTEVLVTYDSDNLYVAFKCYDDPSKIRATMCQRDLFHGDDAVGLLFDTYGEAAWAYQLYVNPYGIQKDYLWSSISGGDRGFDLVWESAALVTEDGYQVEIAVPFASLRFPNKDIQSWRINFLRERPRDSFKEFSWSAIDRDEKCWPCKWGTVAGIENVSPGKGFEILPTFVGYQSGSRLDSQDLGSKFENDDPNGELSLGGKYSISSNMTLEGTYNPDFSQIESDAAQIDVNTTISLFYPERRPFFQEGSDIFRTIFNAFYTRTVNDPRFATKLTSRMDKTSIGFLSALDENTPYIIPLEEQSIMRNTKKSYVNILRATRTLGEDNHLGFIVSDRRIDGGGSGTVFGVDGDIRLSQKYSLVGQYLTTHTKEPNDASLNEGLEDIEFDNGKHTASLDGESFSGDGFITQFRRRARHLSFTIDYNQVAPSYRTQTGYDPWIDYRNLSFYSNYTFYPEKGLFTRITPQFYAEGRWNFDNDKKWENTSVSLTGRMNYAQTGIGIQFNRGSEVWWGKEFNDLWNFNLFFDSRPFDKLGYYVNFDRGQDAAVWASAKGNVTSIYASLDLKPIDRLIIEPNFNFTKSTHVETGEELYSGYITRTRIRFQANRELSIRFVVQYNDFSEKWEFDPLLTYRLSPFSVFYVGSTYDYNNYAPGSENPSSWRLSSRQFFMKLQYLFRT